MRSGVTYIHLWELRKARMETFVFGDIQVVMDSLLSANLGSCCLIGTRYFEAGPEAYFDSMIDLHASPWGRIGVLGKKLITRLNGRGEHL